MAVTVKIDIDRDFTVQSDYDLVFDTLADVPTSVSFFPKVEELEDLGENCYRWNMEKLGVDKYFVQVIYSCEYTSDKKKGSVTWEALDDDEANSDVYGQWKIKKQAGGKVKIHLSTQAALTLPFPRLAKPVVAPFVQREFTGLIDGYIKNLTAHFESGG